MSATVHNLSDYRRPRLRVVPNPPLDYGEFDAAMAELMRAQAAVARRWVELATLGYVKWPT